MNAGKVYEVAVGSIMVYAGAIFVCIDFGILPRDWRLRAVGESMPLKKRHPLFFSILGPSILIIGAGEILRQFNIFG